LVNRSGFWFITQDAGYYILDTKKVSILQNIRKGNTFSLSKGFTLVELLVVIAIIGILATLILLQLGVARSRARDVKRIADVNQLRSAIELYFDDNSAKYPLDITVTELGDYLTQIPNDPLVNTTTYGYKVKDASRLQYQVWSELERKAGGALSGDADIDASTWTGAGNVRGGANGAIETCANNLITDKECVFDQGQK